MKNETLKTIETRRSTRVFLDKEISKEDQEEIFKAIVNAPTAGNMMLYSVINVTSQEKKDKLAILCDNQPFISTGKLVLLFVTNSNRWYEAYNESHEEKYKPTLSDYYLGLCDGLIASENAVIAGESLGIGSCYIGDIIENIEQVKELFKLPKYVNPICLLIMGYKKNNVVSNRPKRFLIDDVICENEFKENAIKVHMNKYEGISEEEAKLKAYDMVEKVFNFKMKSAFFKEMNRGMRFIIEDYKD